jgi:hypothetical protein
MGRNSKIPDTNNPVNGVTPGSMVYQYMLSEDVCPNCRRRWTDPDTTHCARCDAQLLAYASVRRRRKMKRDMKRPRSVEIVVTRDFNTNTLQVSIFSDIGTLLNVHRVESVDFRDARQGKKHLRTFRAAA